MWALPEPELRSDSIEPEGVWDTQVSSGNTNLGKVIPSYTLEATHTRIHNRDKPGSDYSSFKTETSKKQPCPWAWMATAQHTETETHQHSTEMATEQALLGRVQPRTRRELGQEEGRVFS